MFNHIRISAILAAALTAFGCAVQAATYTVNNTNDSGAGSLREAIVSANTSPGLDSIEFNIAGGGLHRITLGSPLPNVSDALIIDGSTQPGWVAGTPQILVEYDNPAVSAAILQFDSPSSGSTLRSMAFIGPTGTLVAFIGSDNAVMQGCWLGIDPDDLTATSGAYYGADFYGCASPTIGGPAPAERNLFANSQMNLHLYQSHDAVIQGNWIGLTPDGDAALPTNRASWEFTGYGYSQQIVPDGLAIRVFNSERALVGGAAPGEGNTTSFTRGNAFELGDSDSIQVYGNTFGVNAAGDAPLARTRPFPYVIAIWLGECDDARVGGSILGQGNTILHYWCGISMSYSDTDFIVQGNQVGHDPTSNLWGPTTIGIEVNGYSWGPTQGGLIGGQLPGEGNRFASDEAVRFSEFVSAVAVLGNEHVTHSDAQWQAMPIQGLRVGDSLDPNDPLDADTGYNGSQNHPLITSASTDGTTTTINATLQSSASNLYRVEFFASRIRPQSTYLTLGGGMETYLGATTISTDGAGDASFTFDASADLRGYFLSATATDISANETSEVSPAHLLPLPGLHIAFREPVHRFPDLPVRSTGTVGYSIPVWNVGDTDFFAASGTITDDPENEFSPYEFNSFPYQSGHAGYFSVSFAPVIEGERSATFHFNTIPALPEPTTVGLLGLGLPPVPHLTTTGTYPYPETQFGTPNDTIYELTIQSETEVPVVFAPPYFELGYGSAELEIVDYPSTATLAQGETATVRFRHTPTVTGYTTNWLRFYFEYNGQTADESFPITCSTRPAGGIGVVDPSPVYFPVYVQGSGSGPVTATVNIDNVGNGDLTFTSPISTVTCDSCGITPSASNDLSPIPAGQSRSIEFEFQQATVGDYTGVFNIEVSTPEGPAESHQVTLYASSATPYRSAYVDTYTLDYGWVHPGDESTTKSFTLTSNGNTPCTITSFHWDGDPTGVFTVLSGLEPTPLAPGESREVVVAFDPVSEGTYSASLTVDGNFTNFSGFQIQASGNAIEGEPPTVYTGVGPGFSRIGIGGEYPSLSAAMAALSNTTLIGGDWEFEITGNMTEGSQSNLSNFQSNGNTVTFRPATNTSPVVSFVVTTMPSITITNSDNIIFEGSNSPGGDTRDMMFLTVYTNSLSVLELRQGTRNITLRNMIMKTSSLDSALSPSAVFVTHTQVAGDPTVIPRGIRIENCLLDAAASPTGAGVTVRTTPYSGQAAFTDGPDVVIIDSDIEAGQRAFFATHVQSLVFERNRVKVSQPTVGFNTYGMLFTSLGSNPPSNDTVVSIRNNVFRQVSARTNSPAIDLGGILLDQEGTGQIVDIENNAISLHLNRTSAANVNKLIGIAQTRATSSTLNLLHNSINIVPSTAPIAGMTPIRSYVLGITDAGNTGTINIRNNVLVNGQPGGSAISITPASSTLSMDGNVYFNDVSSQTVVAAGVPESLAAWQGLGQDANSSLLDPRAPHSPYRGRWLSSGSGDTDLRFTADPGLAFHQSPLPTVTTDIDGETRGTTFVFAGFDEVTDADADGLASSIEDSVPGGDGNGDSIADHDQPNVISYLVGSELSPITLAASTGVFVESGPIGNPSPGDTPPAATFPLGFYQFNLAGVPTGGAVTVLLYLPQDVTVNAIYKYGAEPANPTPHWYRFDDDGTTGAVIVDHLVTLHFVDGARGDDDLTANGVIVDPAGPAFVAASVSDWLVLQ